MDAIKVNTELVGILMTLGDEYISKLPFSVWQYLIANYDKDKMVLYDKNKPLQEQNISKDARVLLTILKLQYFCETEEEKENLVKMLRENEKNNG